ncbi:hypothetical protein ACHAPI_011122 [Fusarium lateritium]
MPHATADYDAIIIGAGFSGVRSLWELKQLGLSVRCFEAASDVGGAWYWNSYPGARTDSEAWVYAMNFAPDVKNDWGYSQRYPPQSEVQKYIGRVVDHYDLRKNIQFDTCIKGAHFNDKENMWTVTSEDGASQTCRFFIPATGPLSLAKQPPFAGLDSFKGEWYQASTWPKDKEVDLSGKRVAIIGTGATGVQIIPKIAPMAKQLTVFQRTANYVLPGRNYDIDQNQAAEIKQNFQETWERAASHPFGLAMEFTGNTNKDATDASRVRQILDSGWECGGFHYQFETFDDLFTCQETNDIASDYVRQKIRAVVHDQETAELLCPKHPFASKRPPCGHFYYEAYNRPNVKLVDIKGKQLDLYREGVRLDSKDEFEFDVIIFALGYDAGTGALSDMDIRGSNGKLLKDVWRKRLDTFAGVLVPEFPNMFSVCGPHIPFGNMPVVLDIQVKWIGQTLRHILDNKLARINVNQKAADAWYAHLHDAFYQTLFAESSDKAGAWFVGANIKDKPRDILFYFGGVPTWAAWLQKEKNLSWANMNFSPLTHTKETRVVT